LTLEKTMNVPRAGDPRAVFQPLGRRAAQMRCHIVRMFGPNRVHHYGGSLSATDLICALYFHKMRYNPSDPAWPDRDRFVLSKGHSVAAQYAALALAGFFPTDELATLKKLDTRLQGHPAMHYTPGLEACTGSLGQGLSFANGVALAARVQRRDFRVYCLLGDGELHEGQVWEAAMTAPRLCLSNLTAIVDQNGLKAMDDGRGCAKPLDGHAARWASFGWRVREVDGHDLPAIGAALDWATDGDTPAVLLAKTVKGKGVSFIEGQAAFHNAALSSEQWEQALAEVTAELERLEGAA
jgi:transketolase